MNQAYSVLFSTVLSHVMSASCSILGINLKSYQCPTSCCNGKALWVVSVPDEHLTSWQPMRKIPSLPCQGFQHLVFYTPGLLLTRFPFVSSNLIFTWTLKQWTFSLNRRVSLIWHVDETFYSNSISCYCRYVKVARFFYHTSLFNWFWHPWPKCLYL